MTRIDRWSLLAGVRFGLATIVAFGHLSTFQELGFLSFIAQFGAFEAILGFLLISGYSITISYQQEPRHFFRRRCSRVYPIYLVSLVLTLAAEWWLGFEKLPSAGVVLVNAFFLNQLFTTTSLVGPAWSLSLECWLYALAPWLVANCQRWSRLFVYVSFGSFLLYTCGRTYFHWSFYSQVGYGGNLLLLSFAWICGLRLAQEREHPKPVLWDLRLLFGGHMALDAAIQLLARSKHHQLGEFFSQDLFALGMQAATLTVVYLVFSRRVLVPAARPVRSIFLRFLGDISYPLYLIHFLVYLCLARTSLHSPLAYYVIAVAVAAIMYWLVDSYSKRRHLKLAPG